MRNRIRRTAVIFVITACALAFVPAAGDQPAFAAVKKPAKVSGLEIKVNAQPYAELRWSAVKSNSKGYVIYRNGKKLAKVDKYAKAYVDRSLKPGASYSYTVKAFNKSKKKTVYGKASAPQKIVKGFTYGKASGGSMMVTGYTGHKAEVKIPARYGGKKVTAIGYEAFQGNLFIRSLTIPENVNAIEDFAFEACSAVKKVYFPRSLRTIGKGAFSGCGQLRLADLSDRVTAIDDGAFLYCISLGHIDLPEDLQRLGQFAFAGSGVGSVEFNGSDLTYLPDRAFCNCEKLTEITIPDCITEIGKRAFSGCSTLRQVNMNKENTQVSEDAFEKCPELEEAEETPEGDVSADTDGDTSGDGSMDADWTNVDPSGDGTADGDGSDGGEAAEPEYLPFTPADPAKTIFREEDFEGYMDIHDGFDAWVESYKKYNDGVLKLEGRYNTYLKMYTGNNHYVQMKAALNDDVSRTESAILMSGEDFKPMYLMIDHGLMAELKRGKMPQNLVLYSGLKQEQVACFAGYPIGSRNGVTVSTQELVDRIGQEAIDEAFMSTTASVGVAMGFSMDSEVLVKIYASQEALERLGAVCVSPFSFFEDEEEILFNAYARYRILDVGTMGRKTAPGSSEVENRTYITLELL